MKGGRRKDLAATSTQNKDWPRAPFRSSIEPAWIILATFLRFLAFTLAYTDVISVLPSAHA